jgi:hypothetical protein
LDEKKCFRDQAATAPAFTDITLTAPATTGP